MLDPKEYNLLKSFRDLLDDTINGLSGAMGQSQLASTASDLAGRWDQADESFAKVLRDIASQARMMPFAQVRPVVNTICDHVRGQLKEVDDRLNG